mmetsp:Transcript_9143/g.19697  ORF Transcript_9143/g.19697 Transcript_9143/m.19697 type:complete len:220 (+) Transcript_9143:1102-1761(+)
MSSAHRSGTLQLWLAKRKGALRATTPWLVYLQRDQSKYSYNRWSAFQKALDRSVKASTSGHDDATWSAVIPRKIPRATCSRRSGESLSSAARGPARIPYSRSSWCASFIHADIPSMPAVPARMSWACTAVSLTMPKSISPAQFPVSHFALSQPQWNAEVSAECSSSKDMAMDIGSVFGSLGSSSSGSAGPRSLMYHSTLLGRRSSSRNSICTLKTILAS